MSKLTERLKRGVQDQVPYAGVWNIGGADDLMKEAADRIEELESAIRGLGEPIGWEWWNRNHPDVTYVDKHRGHDPRNQYIDARPLFPSKPQPTNLTGNEE